MTTTTRRMPPAAVANPRPVHLDADLIAACERLASIGAKIEALLETQHSAADEKRDELAVNDLYTRREVCLDAIRNLSPPSSPEGAVAMARTFSVIANRQTDGTIDEGGQTWLAFVVCDFFAGRPRKESVA